MAVYDQGYRVYQGPLTAARGRFAVLARYALREALASRRTLVFLVMSLVMPLLGAGFVYLHHNAEALAILQLPLAELFPVDERFFLVLLRSQTIATFLVFLSAGATLISVDVRDNALPLYLGRPLSRGEYVLGKLTVLLVLGSAITWLPILLLFTLQSSLEGIGWAVEHARWALGLFSSALVILLLFGLVCLAMSAALRAKAAAEAAFAGVVLLAPLLGKVIDETLKSERGVLLNVFALFDSLARGLMGIKPSDSVSALTAFLTLAFFCWIALWILRRRIRAYEVVG